MAALLVGAAAKIALLAFRIDDQHIDLEVYRFGVHAWWNEGDVYGVLPPTAAAPPFRSSIRRSRWC